MIKRVLLCLLVFIGISMVVSVVQNANRTPEERAAYQKKADENRAQEDRYKAQKLLIADCQTSWEYVKGKQLKDPSSLDWEHREAKLGTYGKKGREANVIVVPYRAKNSFGAVVLDMAICRYDTKTFEVVEVIQ
jgi:hypothetical protein